MVAGGGQQIDADRSDAARRARHHHRPVPGCDAVALQCLHAHRGGETGRPDGGPLAWAQSAEVDDPAGGQAGILGVAAVAPGPDVVAVGQHRVADRELIRRRRHHFAGQVDARHDRIVAHHAAFRRERQRVLVVHAGIEHPDRHVAGRQARLVQRLDCRLDPIVDLPRDQRLKALHGSRR
ncbi:hypothetical protein MHOL44478_09010 [Mycobacterium holsaticum DSM 44478]|nr:hypothetical protein [Mycolicibacterium holsaticum DSM 44478 = JCM 12374]